ncbi:MAG TPA: hypothetical protein VF595_05070 [Tepidisphaeraceae bacterium]|jgi:hypothetical protein
MRAGTTTFALHASYRRAIWTAVVLQLFLTVFLSLILDGGKIASAGGCAMIAFWVGVTVILLRRPVSPNAVDLFFVRWGYIPLLLVAIGLAVWFGKARL